jgi:predicted CXXCH cytochrome family protein
MTVQSLFLLLNVFSLPGGGAAWQGPATRPTGPVEQCVTAECHGGLVAGKVLHAPAAQRKCDSCHVLSDPAEHKFALPVPKAKLCTSCHVLSVRDIVHEPVADGDCTGCHDPHRSNERFLLVENAASSLCFRCHRREEFAKGKHVHGPVEAGACIVCHEAHSSWRPALLSRNDGELCMSCHGDVISDLALARHSHPPVLDGQCMICHDPHASDYKAQVRGPIQELCLSCHEHEKIARLIGSSSHVHGAVTAGDSCVSCHTGHGGPMPKLLAQPLMSLCLSCHDRVIEVPGDGRLTDMAVLLKNNPDQHGPVRRADCSACHDPHASSNFRLLVKEYPDVFYAPFDLKNYDLCFSCHAKELVTVEKGPGVTGFSDGQRNLHFVHVHKEKKGRTCRACHEVHASRQPFHIREKVPFGEGGWEIEIRFEKLPDGGRCVSGCHEERSYHRSPEGIGSAPADLRKGASP